MTCLYDVASTYQSGSTSDDVAQEHLALADVALADVSCWLDWWRGGWLCRIAGAADDVAGQPGSVAGIRAKKTRGVRVARWCAWAVLSSVRVGMQDVGSSPGFHQWIRLVVLYTMVWLQRLFDNFDFWVWIKHPLFQEQALIPVVRIFQKSNTHKFTWFDNLPTPRSY